MRRRRPRRSSTSANIAAVDAIRAGVLPDTTRVLTTGSGCAATGSAAGACSSTTCALVPLTPNDDTPARRARPTAGHGIPFGGDGEPRSSLDGVRGQFVEVQVRRNVAVPQAEHGLDESGDPCGGFQMTQVGLHRPQHQWRRAVAFTEDLAQRAEFDRITQRGAGAVRLDVVDIRQAAAAPPPTPRAAPPAGPARWVPSARYWDRPG